MAVHDRWPLTPGSPNAWRHNGAKVVGVLGVTVLNTNTLFRGIIKNNRSCGKDVTSSNSSIANNELVFDKYCS